MNQSDDSAGRPRGRSKIKKYDSHGSHRVTPPEDVRKAVGMTADEPWAWYWHEDSDRFYIRRSDATLQGIPDDVVNVGVAEARRNGRYLDFAIPPEAVDEAGLEGGQQWEFVTEDEDTMALVETDDDT